MALDPSIPWQGYNAAQDRKKLALAERQMETDEELKRAQLAQAGMDVDKLAERALLKQQMGTPLSPQEEAGLKAWDSMRQTEMTPDMEGNLHPSKRSIYDVIGKTAGISPVAGRGTISPSTFDPTKGDIELVPGGGRKATGSMSGVLLDVMGDDLPKAPTNGSQRLSVADLAGIPGMDADLLNGDPGFSGASTPAAPNPNSASIPQPDTTGMSPHRQKSAWTDTNSANVDLQKEKVKNQVPGMATKEGIVPSADDAKTTKEVTQAVGAIDALMTEYDRLLEMSPNPVAGTKAAQRIEQLQGQIGAQIKTLETLGAYDAGVERLMKDMLGNPIIAGGTTVDLAMNPLKAASSTYTKSDPERARSLNRERSKQFRDYTKTKLRSTAESRGFEAPKPNAPRKRYNPATGMLE